MNEDKHPFTSMHHMIKVSNTVMLWDMYENPVNSGFVLRWWKEKIHITEALVRKTAQADNEHLNLRESHQ